MIATESRIERVARLQAIGDDDQIDPELLQVPRAPDKRRIVTDADKSPVVSVEAVLVAEVERCEGRLEAARDDLRRWRLSHDHAEAPR